MMELWFFWIISNIAFIFLKRFSNESFLYSRVYDLRGAPTQVLSPCYLESCWFGRNRQTYIHVYVYDNRCYTLTVLALPQLIHFEILKRNLNYQNRASLTTNISPSLRKMQQNL